ncbi:MAG: DUF1707 domain-containing protein [Actinomycetota bacterium]|nr:DUF1707 domain-containing protein [Actinomycetota bacterium]
MATGYNMRVGDADRDVTAAQLREHYADGRLTLDELNERLDQTFAAKTKADLNTVLRDLPHAVPTWPQAPAWPTPVATRSSWDYSHGHGDQGQRQSSRRPFAAAATLMSLVWFFVILGAFSLFGLGGGDRPLTIVLFIAALGLFRRLLGFGRRRGMGRPPGPGGPRGPRGPRRW